MSAGCKNAQLNTIIEMEQKDVVKSVLFSIVLVCVFRLGAKFF